MSLFHIHKLTTSERVVICLISKHILNSIHRFSYHKKLPENRERTIGIATAKGCMVRGSKPGRNKRLYKNLKSQNVRRSSRLVSVTFVRL